MFGIFTNGVNFGHETERRLAGETRKPILAGSHDVGSIICLLGLKPDFEMTELEIAIRQTHEKAYKVGYSVGLMHGQEMAWSGVSHLRALLAEKGLNGDTVDAVALTEEVARLKAELASKKDLTLDGALEKIAELQGKLKSADEAIGLLEGLNKDLLDKAATAASRIAELEAERERDGAVIKELRTRTDEWIADCNNAEANFSKANKRIKELEDQLTAASNRINELAPDPAPINITETNGLLEHKKWQAPEVPAQEPEALPYPLEYPELLPGMVQPENTDLLAFGMRIEDGDLRLTTQGTNLKAALIGTEYTKAMYQGTRGYVYVRPRPAAKEGQANA